MNRCECWPMCGHEHLWVLNSVKHMIQSWPETGENADQRETHDLELAMSRCECWPTWNTWFCWPETGVNVDQRETHDLQLARNRCECQSMWNMWSKVPWSGKNTNQYGTNAHLVSSFTATLACCKLCLPIVTDLCCKIFPLHTLLSTLLPTLQFGSGTYRQD